MASFSVTTVNPITAEGTFVPFAGSITGQNTGGWAFTPSGQDIGPSGYGTGLVFFGLNLNDGTSSGTSYPFFKAGAMEADGTYSKVLGPIVGGTPQSPYNLGNAGFAALVVSDIGDPTPVPEPMSLALAGVAWADLAAASRRVA